MKLPIILLSVFISILPSKPVAKPRVPAPIEMRVMPQVCGHPCYVRITVRVDRHPDNRHLVLIIEDPTEYYRSTDIQLNGDQAPIIQRPYEQDNIPAGSFTITAILYRINSPKSEVYRTTTSLEVW